MGITNEQYRARIAHLRSRSADVLFPGDIYEGIAALIDTMVQLGDAIETALFDDLNEARVRELNTALAKAVPAGAVMRVSLTLLDMFDLERVALLAERDPQAFTVFGARAWSIEQLSVLTADLEKIRMQAFPGPA